MATPTKEDTCPKVLICAVSRKVPDGYPTDASSQMGRYQLFINDVAKQLVAGLRAACQRNPNPGAKPKSSDTKAHLLYKHAFFHYLRRPFTHVDFVAKRHDSWRFQHPFFAPQKSISFFRPTPRGFSSWDTTTSPFVASRGVRIYPLFRAENCII